MVFDVVYFTTFLEYQFSIMYQYRFLAQGHASTLSCLDSFYIKILQFNNMF